MDFPDILTQHTVVISVLRGHSGTGAPLYAPDVSIHCLVEEARRRVLDQAGEAVTAEARVFAPLATVAPTGSLVLLPSGRQATVIRTNRLDGGNLPVPSHVEIYTT
jgi:hypothetical protein